MSSDAKSPNETRVRLIWVLDARLPRPLVNRPVWDRTGRLLGIADLVVDRLTSARARVKWLSPAQRRWTTVSPPGWRPEPTLDELFSQRARDESNPDSWPS